MQQPDIDLEIRLATLKGYLDIINNRLAQAEWRIAHLIECKDALEYDIQKIERDIANALREANPSVGLINKLWKIIECPKKDNL